MENQRPAGWRVLPYILGTETCERIATRSLRTNFLLFLMVQFHMDIEAASKIISIWGLIASLTPLVGGFISDFYMDPIYAKIIAPRIKKITNVDGGITLLQRMGFRMVLSIMSMVVSGLIERMRRSTAIEYGTQVSIFWIVPQLMLMGFSEAFNIIGQLEFYNKEFLETMSSMAN